MSGISLYMPLPGPIRIQPAGAPWRGTAAFRLYPLSSSGRWMRRQEPWTWDRQWEGHEAGHGWVMGLSLCHPGRNLVIVMVLMPPGTDPELSLRIAAGLIEGLFCKGKQRKKQGKNSFKKINKKCLHLSSGSDNIWLALSKSSANLINGSLVKGLRRCPLTAESWVRFPYELRRKR